MKIHFCVSVVFCTRFSLHALENLTLQVLEVFLEQMLPVRI